MPNPNEDLVHQNADYIVRKEMAGDPASIHQAADQLRQCALSMDAAHDPQAFNHLLQEIREREQRYGSPTHVETNLLRNGYEDVSIVQRDQYGQVYNGVEATRIPTGISNGYNPSYNGGAWNEIPPAPVPAERPYYGAPPTCYPQEPCYGQYSRQYPGPGPVYGGGWGGGGPWNSPSVGISVPLGHSGVRLGVRLPFGF